MTDTPDLASLVRQAPFSLLDETRQRQALEALQIYRFRPGQPVLFAEILPSHVFWLLEGEVRILSTDSGDQRFTLRRVGAPLLLGWVGAVRQAPCEQVSAATPALLACLPLAVFRQLYAEAGAFADWLNQHTTLSELAAVLRRVEDPNYPRGRYLAEQLRREFPRCRVLSLEPGRRTLTLDPDLAWFVSTDNLELYPPGRKLPAGRPLPLNNTSDYPARLLGVPDLARVRVSLDVAAPAPPLPAPLPAPVADRPVQEAPDLPQVPTPASGAPPEPEPRFPLVRGEGEMEQALACLLMLAQFYGVSARRDFLRKALTQVRSTHRRFNLINLSSILEAIGLRTQLVDSRADRLVYLQTPALIRWENSFAVLYRVTPEQISLGLPTGRLRRCDPETFITTWGPEDQVLLLQRSRYAPRRRFGLRWFLPFVNRYRTPLIQVLVASFGVQLLQLANPLILQQIIDKVIVQNSLQTLNVLGFALIVSSFFEALITTLRTYLFVDTTNRIDLSLGSEIIDHLLRLPLKYFDGRAVGELSSRIGELENIRQFLTGTALTVFLDASFSLIYIVILFTYNVNLTLLTLLTIPVLVTLTLVVSPIIQQQLRSKAEKNATTLSHLVEVLGGIQTIKSQNIELPTRWTWQRNYSSYIATGFENVVTSTAAGSLNNFLNQLSGLVVLWVGASLVVNGSLTLGALISFRIIAGYVTNPILRLSSIWQNFQETFLSLERLADIVDYPSEVPTGETIPMPPIQGGVVFENVSFGFREQQGLQVINVNHRIEPGQFVGVVGRSGSGKSTLVKLLPRLYEPTEGRILIDELDIAKVSLDSLRSQIGIVPQDSLLFDSSILANIALTQPDADIEAIITAAKVACAHEFIMELPNGYNTRVGERGSNLSGGQRQRIAIARTVLQKPRLLILDEATSALDAETERRLSENIMREFRGRTVFFITHRLNTIRGADRILLMDTGRLSETGTHDELMAMRGRYYTLYTQQNASI